MSSALWSLLWLLSMLAPSRCGLPSNLSPVPSSLSASNRLQPLRKASIDVNRSGAGQRRSAISVYAIDAAAGVAAACAATPFMAAIDKAVTEKVSDAQVSISSAVAANLLSFLEHPLKSLSQPSFLLIMTVYCSTYVVVNLISSFSELHQLSAGWLKLIGATVTNTSLGMMKDRYFASVFGRQGAAVSFPLASVLLLLARDVLTVTAAFNLPGTVTNYVRTRGLVTAKRRAEILAQFFVPMLSQFVVTPLHLVALDIYYRPGLHFFDRLFHLESILVPALLTRMARVLCAYGIAGSVNTICKEALNRHFFPPKIPSGGNI